MRRLTLAAVLLLCPWVGRGLPGCERTPPTPAKTPATASQPAAPGDSSAGAAIRLAVIPKGTTHVFWKSVERGAQKAGDELGVEILWKGPLKENDRAQQIQLVQQFVSQKVSGLVLAPLDHTALVGPVRDATAAGIPVVIMDSALDGEPGKDFASYVATDNTKAGRMGGEHLAELLEHKGPVVLLRYQVGSASTDMREKGFLEAVRANAQMQVLVDNRYAGATAGEAKTAALNLLDQLQQARGVFCPNESSTYGMLLALRQAGLAGRIHFVGFDSSPPLVEALRNNEIAALVVQDPQTMGYKAVQQVVARLRGEPVTPVVDTGAVLVTRDNLEDEAIRRLIE